jgi:hypothetical protein
VPPQSEPQPDPPQYIPQEEDSFEIVVAVPVGEDMQEDQQLPQNDNHDNVHEDQEEEGNEDEDKDDEDYTPLSDSEKEKVYHNAEEMKTVGNEAPITTGRLSDLLNRLDITTLPEFRIKRVPRSGREEYKAIVEILSGPNVLSRHKAPAFRATYQDVVGDAAWQATAPYNRKYHDKLKNTVYHLLPQRKKNKSRTFGVKADVSRMLMVHHQDVSVEMNIRL